MTAANLAFLKVHLVIFRPSPYEKSFAAITPARVTHCEVCSPKLGLCVAFIAKPFSCELVIRQFTDPFTVLVNLLNTQLPIRAFQGI